MKPFSINLNLNHAVGFSIGLHLLFVTLMPSMPPTKVLKHDDKRIRKVRLEIKKKPVEIPPESKSTPIRSKLEKIKTTRPMPKANPIVPVPARASAIARKTLQETVPAVPLIKVASITPVVVETTATSRVSAANLNREANFQNFVPVSPLTPVAVRSKASPRAPAGLIQGKNYPKVVSISAPPVAAPVNSFKPGSATAVSSFLSSANSQAIQTIAVKPKDQFTFTASSGFRSIPVQMVGGSASFKLNSGLIAAKPMATPARQTTQMGSARLMENRYASATRNNLPKVLPVSLNQSHRSMSPGPATRLLNFSNPATRILNLAPKKMAKFVPVKQGLTEKEIRELIGQYALGIRGKIAEAKKYPEKAREKNEEGRIMVAFSLGKRGNLLGVSLKETSGHKLLDLAALEAVRRANPFPPIPDELDKETLKLKLPISFVLR